MAQSPQGGHPMNNRYYDAFVEDYNAGKRFRHRNLRHLNPTYGGPLGYREGDDPATQAWNQQAYNWYITAGFGMGVPFDKAAQDRFRMSYDQWVANSQTQATNPGASGPSYTDEFGKLIQGEREGFTPTRKPNPLNNLTPFGGQSSRVPAVNFGQWNRPV